MKALLVRRLPLASANRPRRWHIVPRFLRGVRRSLSRRRRLAVLEPQQEGCLLAAVSQQEAEEAQEAAQPLQHDPATQRLKEAKEAVEALAHRVCTSVEEFMGGSGVLPDPYWQRWIDIALQLEALDSSLF